MKIHFSCPSCGKPHSVDASLAGRRGRCKDCGTVMPIPKAPATGPQAVQAAVDGAPAVSSSPPKSKPRPAAVAASKAEVDDPYGLGDEPVPHSPAAVRLGPIARPKLDADESRPSKARKKKIKQASHDEGPWGEPIRAGVIGLMGLVLVLGRGMKYARRAHQEATIGSQISTGMLILCLLAAVLSVVSVVGAAISYMRGNRSAFRGESVGGQVAWGLSVLASLVVAYMYVRGVTGPTRAELASLDASLSATEQVDTATYEAMMDDVLDHHARLASALESLPGPFSLEGREAWSGLGLIAADAGRIKAEAYLIRPPTRQQVRRLFADFDARYREAIGHTARAARQAFERLELRQGTEFGDMLHEVVEHAREYDEGYRQIYPHGSDPAGWYYVVFGKESGASPIAGPKVHVRVGPRDEAATDPDVDTAEAPLR